MGDRSLAHIEKIVKTYPIEGADKIEMVQLLDFHIVAKKNEFQVGDLVVYVEVDSILPDGLFGLDSSLLDVVKKNLKKATGDDLRRLEIEVQEIIQRNTLPEFEFLRQKKFRIKSLKYNAFKDSSGNPIISMGIVFPISVLKSVSKTLGNEFVQEISEGLDVTSYLGIQKVVEDVEEENTNQTEDDITNFEKWLDTKFKKFKIYRKIKKVIKGEKIKGSWLPIFPPKSDEENAQKIYSKIISQYGREGYYKTEKMEGQSLACYLLETSSWFGLKKNKKFGVCSRNRNIITDDGSDFWKTAKENDIEKKLRSIGKNLFVRGERCAPKLQENIYGFKENRFFVFDVFDIDEQRLYNFQEMIDFCERYGFEHVPILDDNFTLPETVQEILNESNGYSIFGDKVLREGIVIRKKNNTKISFKARSPEYLIHHGK